jgi:hypothetical protein
LILQDVFDSRRAQLREQGRPSTTQAFFDALKYNACIDTSPLDRPHQDRRPCQENPDRNALPVDIPQLRPRALSRSTSAKLLGLL